MKYRNAFLIILLIIIADQVLKIYIKTHFSFCQKDEVLVLGHWFRLHFLENEGMAFGMKLSQGSIGKLMLTSFRLVAVLAGFFLLKKVSDKGYGRGAIICGALILAGALGNLIDSLFYGMIFSETSIHACEAAKMVPFGTGYAGFMHGKVVDMLYFPLFEFTWPKWVPFVGGNDFQFFEPVFNLADAAISTGVLVLLFFQKRLLKKTTPKESSL